MLPWVATGGSNGKEAVTVEASGTVGAFDWTAISLDPGLADPAQAAVGWLETNGYLVSDGAPDLLRPICNRASISWH